MAGVSIRGERRIEKRNSSLPFLTHLFDNESCQIVKLVESKTSYYKADSKALGIFLSS